MIFSTFSGGLPIAALFSVTTMGLSIRMGLETIAAIRVSSSRLALSSPRFLYSDSFFRIKVRGVRPSNSRILESSFCVGGVFKYSIISGMIPLSIRSARVCRKTFFWLTYSASKTHETQNPKGLYNFRRGEPLPVLKYFTN